MNEFPLTLGFFPVLTAVAGICLVFLFWSRTLKRQVEQRTAELRRSEEALRLSEARYRALHRDNPTMIFTMDSDGKVLSVNPTGAEKLGYTIEELEGQPVLTVFHEADRLAVAEQMQVCLRNPNRVYSWQFRKKRKDGGLLWVEELAQAVYDLDGKLNVLVVCQDITDRKRMETELQDAHDELEKRVTERTAALARATEALAASEHDKSLILNTTDAGIIYFDQDMNILWANKAVGGFVNMPPEELRTRHCWEVWHKRKEPCSGCPVISARDTGLPREAEILTPDGRVWFIRAYPVKDETGRIIGMVEFTQDFTERKRMEEALREANLVVENSPAVLFRWKGEDTWPVELVSRNIAQFGYTPDEFLSGSISFSSIIVPDDLDRVTREVRHFCDTGADQFRLEYRIMTKGGSIRWVTEHTNVERDVAGGVRNFEGIVIDVTDRKEIEIELRKNKEKYQAIVDQIDGYIYIASRDYRIQFLNESAGTLFGYSEPGEFCYKVMHGRDSVCPECSAETVFEGTTLKREWLNPTNGHWYHVVDTPIFHTDGSILRQTVATDITERKLAEGQLERQKQQLEVLNRTLEHRVEEEVTKNREKDVILIQQNRQAALGEMLDHIAHQWKQPLNAISILLQYLEDIRSSGELGEDQVRETVGSSLSLLSHMSQTIDTFRDFYRPEKEKTVFSIKDSLEKTLMFFEPALKFHSMEVDLHVDAGLSAVGYPNEFTQVLLNLLANARDAFSERKIEDKQLTINGFAEGARAVVTIADNAGGIPEAIIDRVFDLYFSTRGTSGGTGVGLYMSKNIIEKNMQGALSVENIEGGARFRIELTMPR